MMRSVGLVLVTALTGCSLVESTSEKQLKACATEIKLGLNDPNSLEVLSTEGIDVNGGGYRMKVNFTAKNAMGGRVRGAELCGFKSRSSDSLDPEDRENKIRSLARKLKEHGISVR